MITIAWIFTDFLYPIQSHLIKMPFKSKTWSKLSLKGLPYPYLCCKCWVYYRCFTFTCISIKSMTYMFCVHDFLPKLLVQYRHRFLLKLKKPEKLEINYLGKLDIHHCISLLFCLRTIFSTMKLVFHCTEVLPSQLMPS